MSEIKLTIDDTEYELTLVGVDTGLNSVYLNGNWYAKKAIQRDIDWEIVESGYAQNNDNEIEQQYISKVKRISDGLLLSPDDYIEFEFVGRTVKGVINHFTYCNGIIDVYLKEDLSTCYRINKIDFGVGVGERIIKKHKPKVPLFTLNDVDIYERDTFYSVNKKSFKILQWTAYSEFKNQWSYPELEYFSTEQKAKEYILQNKPIQVRYIDIRFMTREELLRYFKSKINIT